jgi:hypothetical protein
MEIFLKVLLSGLVFITSANCFADIPVIQKKYLEKELDDNPSFIRELADGSVAIGYNIPHYIDFYNSALTSKLRLNVPYTIGKPTPLKSGGMGLVVHDYNNIFSVCFIDTKKNLSACKEMPEASDSALLELDNGNVAYFGNTKVLILSQAAEIKSTFDIPPGNAGTAVYWTGPIFSDGSFAFRGTDFVYVINRDGTLKWSIALKSLGKDAEINVGNAFAITDDRIWFLTGTYPTRIVILDSVGRVVINEIIPDYVSALPKQLKDKKIVMATGKFVYLFSETGERLARRAPETGSINSPPIPISDQMVGFMSENLGTYYFNTLALSEPFHTSQKDVGVIGFGYTSSGQMGEGLAYVASYNSFLFISETSEAQYLKVDEYMDTEPVALTTGKVLRSFRTSSTNKYGVLLFEK